MILFAMALVRFATASAVSADPERPTPSRADVAYGEHSRQRLDFWDAQSGRPAPVVFYLHAGGWVNGDKQSVTHVADYLRAGISVVSVNYRYSTQAQEAGIWPPVEWPLRDAARALQFVRHQASRWNINPIRIAATGESAGGCAALWLAFHPEMGVAQSPDPIARESTRLFGAAVTLAQTSLDPLQLKQWTPNGTYGGHAFGFMPDPKNLKTRDTQFPQFLAARDSILPWINEYSPYAHVTADDPPVYLYYSAPPTLRDAELDPAHSSKLGVMLQERLLKVGVACELVYPGATGIVHPSAEKYLIARLSPGKHHD